MDRNTAKQLIENTFNFPFDEAKFRYFSINLLNDVDETKAFGYISGNYIKNSYKDHVTKYRRLGTYTDPSGDKIDVLIVHLKKEWALDRSRTMLRNFVADYLKNRDEKEAALVGYTTTDPEDWRFSFVKMEYKLEQTESGKIKVKEELTPAKRYSFLVGKNEPNHTAQSQLVDILENDRKNPSLNDIETAFSVDAVTKQFYKDYRDHFEKIWHELDDIASKDPKIAAEFETKSIDTSNFAKKLMGQIVFLYFLQKKGWLGVGKDDNGNFKEWGTGPKNFLHRLFNKEFTNYKNFFKDVLQPLFYEALSTEHSDDYFSQLDCKIPFLNGGLFEPLNGYNWVETDICIDNDIIANVFKTLDQYNFTVREDEPLEKEVAVDPEMLGKVFENLLPENLRKGKGAYYTPRTIVHYMCQESLINYLDTSINSPLERGETSQEVSGCVIPKEDIETLIREGDIILELETAIEYGTKSYKSVLMDSIKDNAKVLDEALANIKVCDPAIGSGAFPVGMLTEIVKARKVLELYLANKHSIYDLKRHCIQNSLYGVDIDSGAIDIAKLRLWLSLVVDEDDYTTIQTLPNLDYKIMQGNSLIEEFHGISLDIDKKDNEQLDAFSGGSDLDDLISELHKKQADFFNAEHPKDKKKKRLEVETAIFNIFHNELEKKKNISTQEAKEVETDLQEMTHGNKIRNFFPWKLYFADVFHDKGGFDIVIANPPYVTTKYGKISDNLKKIYLNTFESAYDKLDLYVLFTEKAIKISKQHGDTTFITPWNFLANFYSFKIRKFLLDNVRIKLFNKLPPKVFGSVIVDNIISIFERNSENQGNKILLDDLFNKDNQNYVNQDDYLKNDKYVFTLQYDIIANKILNKMQTDFKEMGEIALNYIGIMTGNQKEMISNKPIYKNSKPVLSGKDINKWIYVDKGNYVNFDKSKIHSNDNEEVYLAKKKILLRKTGRELIACIDKSQYFTIQSLYNIVVKNNNYTEEYLLALLNSKLFTYIYNKFFITNPEVFPYIKRRHLDKFPIKKTSIEEQKPFIELCKKIELHKSNNSEADTTALVDKIDIMVYKLYELTYDEVKIVDPQCPFSQEEYEKFELEKESESESIVEEQKTQNIPEVAVTSIKPVISKPVPKQVVEPTGCILMEFTVGQHVIHPTFGEGEVQHIAGSGESATIHVKFGKETKKLVAGYAKLRGV